MDNHFPLPPLSNLKAERTKLLDEYCALFTDEENQINVLAMKASFSSLLNESRDVLWNQVIQMITQTNQDGVERFKIVLRAMFRISSFV